VRGDRDTVIAVQRTDLSDTEKTRLALYDNRAGELAKWDRKVLKKLVDGNPLQGTLIDMLDERDQRRILAAQEEAQPLADGGAEDTDQELAAPAPVVDETKPPDAQVRMVQLYLTVATQPIFVSRVRELAQRLGTKTITETVEAAVAELHKALCVTQQTVEVGK
jgi:hypothetical protein